MVEWHDQMHHSALGNLGISDINSTYLGNGLLKVELIDVATQGLSG